MPWLCPWCGTSVDNTGDAVLSHGRKYGVCKEHGKQKCLPSAGEIKRRVHEYPYIILWEEPL